MTEAASPVEWTEEGVRLIDQRALPTREVYVVARTVEEVAGAIVDMVVRGAPAIGIAAAMGVALAARNGARGPSLDAAVALLRGTRPTAVNLFWALDRMQRVAALAEADAALPRDCSTKRSAFGPRTWRCASRWASTARHSCRWARGC